MQPVIELRDVEFGYGRAAPILRRVNLSVEAGEFIAIAGPNGGGKTTLLRVILGLERATAGRALLFGEPAPQCTARAQIGYLPQRAAVGLSSPVTVRELVTCGRAAVEWRSFRLSAAGKARVEGAIDRLGLGEVAAKPVIELSGGQQQRAFLAKLLAAEPRLIALDEPTVGVDAEAQERLGRQLAELHRELGVTILYVSHEFGAVEEHVRRLVLVQGGITHDGPVSDLPQLWHDPSHHHGRSGPC